MASTCLLVSNEVLPISFKNEIVETKQHCVIIRSNLTCMEEINEWVVKFGELTNTKWNSRDSNPLGQKMVCSKKFVCHHSGWQKVPKDKNKKGLSKNADCQSGIYIKVKLDTPNTRILDEFVRQGLRAVITIKTQHSHTLNSAETLRFLPATTMTKEIFVEYFNDGLGITESSKYHQEAMKICGVFKEEDFANNRINPAYKVIRQWYNEWKLLNLDPRSEPDLVETWSDLKVDLRKKYWRKNKKSRKRPIFTEVEEKLIRMISANGGKYGTLPVKKEDIENMEIKITSVESQQEPASIENQEVAPTSEQLPETETTMTAVESIQPSISCIQPQNSSNSLPFVQLPSNTCNQNQDSNKPLPQLLDTVYIYYKQPPLPPLLLTTQCNPQLNSGDSLNQDKLSTCTSILNQNSSNSLTTAFDKSSLCNNNQPDSNYTISTVQNKPSFGAGNNQESDVIMSDDQIKLSTCNDNTQQKDSHSAKSASTDQSTKSNVNESEDNKGFFSCQMMSAKALQDIAKELGVKNDIERKRLELEERKVKAFELIAQRLQM